MARVTGVMMFIVFVVKRTESNAEAETQQTKPDPYFEEWKDNAWQRPSRCHVCRLLVRELYESFTRTKRKDILYTEYQLDEQPLKKKIVYEKSEIRLLETMENVCDQMKSYVSRARRKFPYVKGAKSHFREGLDNMLANSTVKLNIEAPPDDLVDDSTKEIIRLKFKCVHMLEEFEEDITEWYFNYREENLLEWLCKFRVLAVEEQGSE
ncbi:protein canopy homolog 4-like [Dendronephthya gigantea]|uniref:protein canopy homolog 4-like n=1 Tax=Dendronephthya gigantea TaxID=151771 RepID=UPI00106CEB77|nr:protein canopy homolog 4-like [Dendronephthya gigantea]